MSTIEAPFSTASSTVSMALCRGSSEPPRFGGNRRRRRDLSTKALAEEETAHRQEGGHAECAAALRGVVGSQLDRELVLPGVAITDKLGGTGVEVLRGVLDALGEGWRGAGRTEVRNSAPGPSVTSIPETNSDH